MVMIRHVKASNRLRCSGNSPDAVADTAVFTVWNGNTVNVLVLLGRGRNPTKDSTSQRLPIQDLDIWLAPFDPGRPAS
jgi:hypothetical protein